MELCRRVGTITYFFANSGESRNINRRALVLGETSTPAVPIADVNAMEKVFSNQNFSEVVRFPNRTKSEIIAKMQELFESSIESDVNYLYFTCHGGIDGRIYIGSDKTAFSGWELASILKQYKGKFVVMLEQLSLKIIQRHPMKKPLQKILIWTSLYQDFLI